MNPKAQSKKKIAVTTLGCKVNQFESAAFLSELARQEVELVPFSSPAEVYIINTCAAHQASLSFTPTTLPSLWSGSPPDEIQQSIRKAVDDAFAAKRNATRLFDAANASWKSSSNPTKQAPLNSSIWR